MPFEINRLPVAGIEDIPPPSSDPADWWGASFTQGFGGLNLQNEGPTLVNASRFDNDRECGHGVLWQRLTNRIFFHLTYWRNYPFSSSQYIHFSTTLAVRVYHYKIAPDSQYIDATINVNCQNATIEFGRYEVPFTGSVEDYWEFVDGWALPYYPVNYDTPCNATNAIATVAI